MDGDDVKQDVTNKFLNHLVTENLYKQSKFYEKAGPKVR